MLKYLVAKIFKFHKFWTTTNYNVIISEPHKHIASFNYQNIWTLSIHLHVTTDFTFMCEHSLRWLNMMTCCAHNWLNSTLIWFYNVYVLCESHIIIWLWVSTLYMKMVNSLFFYFLCLIVRICYGHMCTITMH
jgi:hypothetical protein